LLAESFYYCLHGCWGEITEAITVDGITVELPGHRMNRNYLAHEQGDAINPILAAIGYNFRLILKWIKALWLKIWITWNVFENPAIKYVYSVNRHRNSAPYFAEVTN